MKGSLYRSGLTALRCFCINKYNPTRGNRSDAGKEPIFRKEVSRCIIAKTAGFEAATTGIPGRYWEDSGSGIPDGARAGNHI